MRLILAIFIFSFISCKSDLSNPDVKYIYDEVILIHDEVMPESATIHKLRKQLKSLNNPDSLSYELMLDLEQADEMMMQWMADFGVYRKMDREKDEVKIQFLINEKTRITEVSERMKTAINNAQNYLENKE